MSPGEHAEIPVAEWASLLLDCGLYDDHLTAVALGQRFYDLKAIVTGNRWLYSSPSVNVLKGDAIRRFLQIREGRLYYNHYYRDPVSLVKVHCSPVEFEVGIDNPDGWGIVPKPGWRLESDFLMFGSETQAFIESYLLSRKPLSFGVQHETVLP